MTKEKMREIGKRISGEMQHHLDCVIREGMAKLTYPKEQDEEDRYSYNTDELW